MIIGSIPRLPWRCLVWRNLPYVLKIGVIMPGSAGTLALSDSNHCDNYLRRAETGEIQDKKATYSSRIFMIWTARSPQFPRFNGLFDPQAAPSKSLVFGGGTLDNGPLNAAEVRR
jgi:hypothetical protein